MRRFVSRLRGGGSRGGGAPGGNAAIYLTADGRRVGRAIDPGAEIGFDLSGSANAFRGLWGTTATLIIDGEDGPSLTITEIRDGATVTGPDAAGTTLQWRIGSGGSPDLYSQVVAVGVAPAIVQSGAIATRDNGDDTFTVTLTLPEASGTPDPEIAVGVLLDGSDVTGRLDGLALTVEQSSQNRLVRVTFIASNGVGAPASQSFAATIPSGIPDDAYTYQGRPYTYQGQPYTYGGQQ